MGLNTDANKERGACPQCGKIDWDVSLYYPPLKMDASGYGFCLYTKSYIEDICKSCGLTKRGTWTDTKTIHKAEKGG